MHGGTLSLSLLNSAHFSDVLSSSFPWSITVRTVSNESSFAFFSAVSHHHTDSEALCLSQSLPKPHPRYWGCVIHGLNVANRITVLRTYWLLVALGRLSQSLNDRSFRAILESILQYTNFAVSSNPALVWMVQSKSSQKFFQFRTLLLNVGTLTLGSLVLPNPVNLLTIDSAVMFSSRRFMGTRIPNEALPSQLLSLVRSYSH